MTDKLDAERLYYVKKKNGDVCVRQSHLFSTLKTEKAVPFIDFDDDDIKEVLAPVPSYNEFDALKMNCEFIHRCLDGSRKKNTELMKLLKECSEYMTFRYSSKKTLELLTKINEVLR